MVNSGNGRLRQVALPLPWRTVDFGLEYRGEPSIFRDYRGEPSILARTTVGNRRFFRGVPSISKCETVGFRRFYRGVPSSFSRNRQYFQGVCPGVLFNLL